VEERGEKDSSVSYIVAGDRARVERRASEHLKVREGHHPSPRRRRRGCAGLTEAAQRRVELPSTNPRG
jgi:hypothetical protein